MVVTEIGICDFLLNYIISSIVDCYFVLISKAGYIVFIVGIEYIMVKPCWKIDRDHDLDRHTMMAMFWLLRREDRSR